MKSEDQHGGDYTNRTKALLPLDPGLLMYISASSTEYCDVLSVRCQSAPSETSGWKVKEIRSLMMPKATITFKVTYGSG